jgi:hypothetical protein
MAEIDLKGNGILLISAGSLDSNHTSGALEAHEYTHTIQSYQFKGTQKEFNSYCCTKTHMPWWMVEGGASFAQTISVFFTSYDLYVTERDKGISEFADNRDNVFTLSWITNYLDISSTSKWSDPKNSSRMYDVGYLVNEALVAIKGPDISMKLNKDVANGMSWPQAFEANMGVSWTEALPKLATAIKAQLKN